MGPNDLDSGGVRYKPTLFIPHEKYYDPIFANDIGLIKVNKIEFNEKVQPIKFSKNYVNGDTVEQLRATGWGRWIVSIGFLSFLITQRNLCCSFSCIKKMILISKQKLLNIRQMKMKNHNSCKRSIWRQFPMRSALKLIVQ